MDVIVIVVDKKRNSFYLYLQAHVTDTNQEVLNRVGSFVLSILNDRWSYNTNRYWIYSNICCF